MKIREPFENYSTITRHLFKFMHPFMSFVMDSPLPVSYTHLTLPTSDLV